MCTNPFLFPTDSYVCRNAHTPPPLPDDMSCTVRGVCFIPFCLLSPDLYTFHFAAYQYLHAYSHWLCIYCTLTKELCVCPFCSLPAGTVCSSHQNSCTPFSPCPLYSCMMLKRVQSNLPVACRSVCSMVHVECARYHIFFLLKFYR